MLKKITEIITVILFFKIVSSMVNRIARTLTRTCFPLEAGVSKWQGQTYIKTSRLVDQINLGVESVKIFTTTFY